MCHSSQTARTSPPLTRPRRPIFFILFSQWAVDLKWIYGYSAEQMIRIYVFTKHSRCLQLKWTRRKIFQTKKRRAILLKNQRFSFLFPDGETLPDDARKCKKPKSRSHTLTCDVSFWVFNRTLMLQGDSRLTGRMYRERQTEAKCWKIGAIITFWSLDNFARFANANRFSWYVALFLPRSLYGVLGISTDSTPRSPPNGSLHSNHFDWAVQDFKFADIFLPRIFSINRASSGIYRP